MAASLMPQPPGNLAMRRTTLHQRLLLAHQIACVLPSFALRLVSLSCGHACVLQAKLASNDLSAALPIVLLLGSITQQQPALLSDYLSQLKDCMASFAGASTCLLCTLHLLAWLTGIGERADDKIVLSWHASSYRVAINHLHAVLCCALQGCHRTPPCRCCWLCGPCAGCAQTCRTLWSCCCAR